MEGQPYPDECGKTHNKHGATILVVDDEQEIVRVLRRSLSAHGYMVLVATSGEEAMEVVSQQRPDLLLLDLLLPGMSGLEVCRKVREASNVLSQEARMSSSIAPNARSVARCASDSPCTPLILSRS